MNTWDITIKQDIALVLWRLMLMVIQSALHVICLILLGNEQLFGFFGGVGWLIYEANNRLGNNVSMWCLYLFSIKK